MTSTGKVESEVEEVLRKYLRAWENIDFNKIVHLGGKDGVRIERP